MLSTTSILSRDQGKLFSKPKSEDEYYSRFAAKTTPKPRLEKWQA